MFERNYMFSYVTLCVLIQLICLYFDLVKTHAKASSGDLTMT